MYKMRKAWIFLTFIGRWNTFGTVFQNPFFHLIFSIIFSLHFMDDLFSNYKISAWNTFYAVFQPQAKSKKHHRFPLQSYSITMLKYTLILILHNWNLLCQNIIIPLFWKTPRLFVFGHLLKFKNVHFTKPQGNLFLPLWKIWTIQQKMFLLLFQCENKRL